MISSDLLSGYATVRHGFLTRRGGVSRGLFDSLNCGAGSGDDAGAVRANREIAVRRMGLDEGALVTVHQVHSSLAIAVDGPWPDAPPQGDALVTKTPGVVIGVLTADCAPVLLADAKAGIVAAAHAGWKGALGGVLGATVETMESLGARRGDIAAVCGPCIAQQSYEVGGEFRARFVHEDAAHGAFFRTAPRNGRFLFDLKGFVAARLGALALKAVEVLEHDTYASEDAFFSYRRATHKKEDAYGRQLSAIALRPSSVDA
ncbi:peptidoglycan editing factor PgeF [Varunaivibrio sulfuroxidans]|uniref:Purine nucleoside phosphorylase n=1 Tax=Varunaivibrio sulfuroxidans TaxID=1773489 RepID=A0A4R3J8P7_9PROT|nr:peptidoglycan editing factor PgeF [Varunaivibrio sulfuroxidans]TCS60900.1 hypothetical protein EDD55_10960 [Varunaivibrio sulfuroxidans]WES31691.1 peptidoglycan editing factor PgeF [Varunaivibrio sulfuroxidans]